MTVWFCCHALLDKAKGCQAGWALAKGKGATDTEASPWEQEAL